MENFSAGPFKYCHDDNNWSAFYAYNFIVSARLAAAKTRNDVIVALRAKVAEFKLELQENNQLDRIDLIDLSGTVITSFFSDSSCGMTAGLIDDRSDLWIRSADRLQSRNVSIKEFSDIFSKEAAPENAWIAGLLPDHVLCKDSESWIAPTNWEIKHIVGENSFTGISGARCANFCGLSPQNFRKYLADDSAKNRQSISFSAWHILLHRLGVQKI